MSSDNANVYNLVVSAINVLKALSSYSSVGSNILSLRLVANMVKRPARDCDNRSIGCENGSGIAEDRPSNTVPRRLHPLNSNCDYTSTMNGTSSAAPNLRCSRRDHE